ncbi:hypothetical protein A0H81_08801 [Grifola frondosa]|uniref:Uncharacterized protein n=1 Tax=Grifola frondosa TaxID=5627 RepID=A0A1C7M418_GRIFR|nr:hypothetical protein A0H81_08801 [Grifola frondosa]
MVQVIPGPPQRSAAGPISANWHQTTCGSFLVFSVTSAPVRPFRHLVRRHIKGSAKLANHVTLALDGGNACCLVARSCGIDGDDVAR